MEQRETGRPTGTEALVCADIARRQKLGIAKYGVTVADNPLGLLQWLEHAYQECLDQAVYLRRAMGELPTQESPSGESAVSECVMIGFPASTGLPCTVRSSWGIFWPGRDRRLFCLQPGEACCIEVDERISQVRVAICQGDKEQCELWVNRHFELSGAGTFALETDGKACCFYRKSQRLIVIWMSLPSIEDGALTFALLGHECVHAVNGIMDAMGMKPDFANEEFTAYTLQMLMQSYIQSIGVPVPLTEGGEP